jgi:hypothetical protein
MQTKNAVANEIKLENQNLVVLITTDKLQKDQMTQVKVSNKHILNIHNSEMQM